MVRTMEVLQYNSHMQHHFVPETWLYRKVDTHSPISYPQHINLVLLYSIGRIKCNQ